MKEAVYKGHGQIESYPDNSALWGVIAHEQRHANFNKYMASLKNEDVDQKIKISIQFSDGKPVPVNAYTEAKFTKSKVKTEENFLKLLYLNFKISKIEKQIAGEEGNDNDNINKTDKRELLMELGNLKKELENIQKKIFNKNDIHKTFQAKKEYAKFYGIYDFQKYNIPPVVLHNPVISGYLVNEKLDDNYKNYESTDEKKLGDITRQKDSYINYIKNIWDKIYAKFLYYKDYLDNFNIDFFKPENSNNDYFDVYTTGDIESEEDFSITIKNIAKSFVVYSKKFDDAYTPLNVSGTVTLNGTDIDISSSDSLYDIAQLINWGEDTNENGELDYDEGEDVNNNEELDGGTKEHGVYAYIEDNRLYLKNIEPGDKSIVIDDSDNIFHDFEIIKENPVNDGTYFPHVLQEGENAQYTINGEDFTSESNTVNYNGLTINLKQVTSVAKDFKIAKNSDEIYNDIVSFVNNYNNMIESLNIAIKDENPDNLFTGKIIKRGMKISLFSDVSSKDVTDFGLDLKENKETLDEMEVRLLNSVKNYNNSMAEKLRSLGLKGNDDETVSVNSVKLKNAIKNDFKSIKEVFLSENGVKSRLKEFADKVLDQNNGIIAYQIGAITSEDLEKIKSYYNKAKITAEYLTDKLNDINSLIEKI